MNTLRFLSYTLIGPALIACGGGGGGGGDDGAGIDNGIDPNNQDISFEGTAAGTVVDTQGEPLEGVTICLQSARGGNDCSQTAVTDRRGRYELELREPGTYVVRIKQQETLQQRLQAAYTNYAWEPATYDLAVSANGNRSGYNFTGGFNFSNFQGSLLLRASDFPELLTTTYKTPGDYVVLKVYTLASDGSEKVVFQDRIVLVEQNSAFNFQIQASLPLEADTLRYEVYSLFEQQVLFGALPLRNQ